MGNKGEPESLLFENGWLVCDSGGAELEEAETSLHGASESVGCTFFWRRLRWMA